MRDEVGDEVKGTTGLERATVARVACLLAIAVAAAACHKRGPRDVDNQNPRSEFADGPRGMRSPDAGANAEERTVATPVVAGSTPRVLARASSEAIATSPTHVYFGDEEDDALYALPKREGGPPQRLARRAPTAGGLALGGGAGEAPSVVWIARPGDVVFRMSTRQGSPSTVREGAIFTDVAVAGDDVFLTEAHATKGVLTRVTGGSVVHVATTDGSPRGIAVDDDDVFIASSTQLARTPRGRGGGAVTELARGAGFGSPVIDDTFVYATAVAPDSRARRIVRVKKAGGPLETVATAVRDAPIAVHRGVLYWFDAERPALLSAKVSSPPSAPRLVAEDPTFERPRALAVDADGAFVATRNADGAFILRVPVRSRDR